MNFKFRKSKKDDEKNLIEIEKEMIIEEQEEEKQREEK